MEDTQEAIYEFLKETPLSYVGKEKILNGNDPLATQEQQKRDQYISALLLAYVTSYQGKVKHSRICRYIILVPCILIIIAFSGLLAILSLKLIVTDNSLATKDLVAFVTACISFISLIIGLLTIITKYFFPENDEQYVTAIVKAIQKNDLENKRENVRYRNEVNKLHMMSESEEIDT